MSSEVTGKKLSDLRVTDLKLELEKRGLETGGIKCTLLERLQKVGVVWLHFVFFFSLFVSRWEVFSLLSGWIRCVIWMISKISKF